MTGKKMNIIIVIFLVVVSAFVGISAFVKNSKLNLLDQQEKAAIDKEVEEYNKRVGEYITVSSENDKNNSDGEFTSGGTNGGSGGGVNQKQQFNNFFEMYDFALEKYNNATYTYSVGRGYALTDGTSSILNVTNRKLALNYTRARNRDAIFFDFSMKGKVMDGFPDVNIDCQQYSDYSKYCYYYSKYGSVKTSLSGFEKVFKWNMKDLFHIVNPNTVTEITSFYYDKYNKVFRAKVVLNPVLANVNLGSTVEKLTLANKPATFSKTELDVIVDEYGLFKSISYNNDFVLEAEFGGVNFTASCRANYTETFTIIDNGTVKIKQPEFSR